MVPCRFCVECRSRYRREWALRCAHEASGYSSNCFGTLTYSDRWLPKYGTLVRRDFQLFVKRLRRSIEPKRVRYYHAGEYGEDNGRPHYHFLLFGHSFRSTVVLRDGEFPVHRSAELEELWKFGYSSFSPEVNFATASYVAGYVMKKVDQVGRKKKYNVDAETGEMVEIEREYSTMSRGGRLGRGIGRKWYERYGAEVHMHDSVVHDGQTLPVPRRYDEWLRETDEVAYQAVKVARMEKMAPKLLEEFEQREAREAIAVSRQSQRRRLI